MAGPKTLPNRLVPRPPPRAARLPESVANHEKHALNLVQFLQTNTQDQTTAITDLNGQKLGGVVLAQHLPSRFHTYQLSAPIAPHVGDLPTQPSAVAYDGPLNVSPTTLPNGVNGQYGYIRWTGYISPPDAANYTLHLRTSSGGANLFINQQQLVGMLTTNSSIDETAQSQLGDGTVPIVVEYQYGTEAPELTLTYSANGSKPAPVPNTWLSSSVNQMSGYLVGYYFNGNKARWYP